MNVQLVVTYADHSIGYYPVRTGTVTIGWKLDAGSRCLVIGKGVPRTYVPLDRVMSFSIEEYAEVPDADPPEDKRDCPGCGHSIAMHSADGCWDASRQAADQRCPCRAPHGKSEPGVDHGL